MVENLKLGSTNTFNLPLDSTEEMVGYRLADGVEWKTPTGSKKFCSVAITGEIVIGKLIASLDKTATPWLLVMQDPMRGKS